MDEVDAFPFKGSELLEAMLKRSLRGRLVMMSATPSKELVARFRKPGKDLVTLHTRFHKKPIPVPKLVVGPAPYLLLSLLRLLRRYQKEGKQCFIFVPTVALSEDLHRKTSLFCPKGNYVSSKREKRAKIIADFTGAEQMLCNQNTIGQTAANLTEEAKRQLQEFDSE